MNKRVILDQAKIDIIIKRLCFQLIEKHHDFSNSVILGLQPRGVLLAKRLSEALEKILGKPVQTGYLDVTFYRDDIGRRKEPLIPNSTSIEFSIEGKNVIMVDDVLYTGRTIRAGMDAMLAHGRPELVELLVLIDRRYSRDLPVAPNYIGKAVDSISSERVIVEWKGVDKEDKVVLYTPLANE